MSFLEGDDASLLFMKVDGFVHSSLKTVRDLSMGTRDYCERNSQRRG